jgi:hypothetical protein
MRHVLGALGVLAAGVLLAVSAAMNWRFGYSLGVSEVDKQIYGAASAAADCFKALVPFFFFAALKNKMWSQAVASAIVWVVVSAYSLTSALGHAALNRNDTSGHRAQEAASYKDLRADLKRAQDQLSWVPQHRPASTVQSDIDGLKNQRAWSQSKGCTEVTGKFYRDFCQQFHTLTAEAASGKEAAKLEARIADINGRIGQSTATAGGAEADPQAAALTKLFGLLIPNLKLEDVQTTLTVFVAILLEIGSGLGMYVAFSSWRLYDRAAPTLRNAAVRAEKDDAEPLVLAGDTVQLVVRPRLGANDNVTAPIAAPAPRTVARLIAPETDVERFHKERIDSSEGSSLTATTLYEDYCAWCEEQNKEPLALPTFGREFGELGVQKAKIAGRVRYIGINLRAGRVEELEEDRRSPERIAQVA